MADISAAMVKQLRDQTGQAMMDCKKALQETGGDIDKAVDLLRKKGMAVLEKRGGRETNEGQLIGRVSGDGRRAVLMMLCSETDFTSKSDDFRAAAEATAAALLDAATAPADAEGAQELPAAGGRTVGQIINEIVSKTGEKITLGEFARFDLAGPGLIYCYVHFNGKVGTLLHLAATADAAAADPQVRALAADLAMHITASMPLTVTREQMDPAMVAHEKEIAAQQVQGKPAQIVDKIVAGKMNKWYQQHVLLEQPFVKDDKKSVQDLLQEVGKAAGSTLSVERFSRLQIG
ncbi:MAG: translation elongation factor Ts [Sedimentisphaerales bacterium]|nr:translation elongation factor Ts [Sedimentisphaerales bacterium]